MPASPHNLLVPRITTVSLRTFGLVLLDLRTSPVNGIAYEPSNGSSKANISSPPRHRGKSRTHDKIHN